MQIKTTVRYHLTEQPSLKCLKITNAGKTMEKRKPSYTVGGNVSCYSHYGKQYGQSSENWKIKLLYEPAVSLLRIYSGKPIIHKDTCTPMFIEALFTIAKTQKQSKCSSTDEWIKKMWKMLCMCVCVYIYIYIYIYICIYNANTEFVENRFQGLRIFLKNMENGWL